MPNYLQLLVVKKIIETNTTTTLLLKVLEGNSDYLPGQFLTFIFDNLGPKEIRRSYSLSSTPGINKQLSITVKKVPNGTISRFLVETVKKGTTLKALSSAGQFSFSPQKELKRDIFLIGGGSGITPLFSILQAALYSEPQSKVTLVYANTNEASTIFLKALTKLAKKHPNQLQIVYLWSNPLRKSILIKKNIQTLSGHLSNDLLEKFIGEHLQYQKNKALFYICGPKGLMVKSFVTLGFMGFKSEQIKREIFTILEPIRPLAEAFPNSIISLQQTDKNLQFSLFAGQSILEAAENKGLELPFSCRSGTCTTCAAQVIKGEARMYTQEGILDTHQTKGILFTCVGYPLSKSLVLKME